MMSADVEGSFADFFPAAVVVPLVAGSAVLDVLPSSVCALFFFRAILTIHLAIVYSDMWGLRRREPKIRSWR
jgi:hypothetical protein